MGSLIKNNPFAGLYEGHGEPVRHGADEFIRKHGADNLQHIRILDGAEFLLHSGDEVFSSFQPRKNPTIIRIAPGREFYEHGNWILSTAGMKSRVDHPYPNDGHMGNHTDTMAAINNHYNLAFDPRTLRSMFLEEVAGWDWHFYDDSFEDPWDALDYHLFYDNHGGSRELNQMPPELFQEFVGLLNDSGSLERKIVDHPSFNVYDLRNPNGISNPDVLRALEENIDGGTASRITLPSGAAARDFTRRSGILLWTPLRSNRGVATAYRDGKQIVFHPDYAMPDKLAYPNMLFPPFDQNLDNPWGTVPEIPWDADTEINTLVRAHIYPAAEADQLVPLGPEPHGWREGRE